MSALKWLVLALVFTYTPLTSQDMPIQNELNEKIAIDTINKKRLLFASLAGGIAYTSASIALYDTWYKQYPLSSFHFYDDWNEWQNMDKMGHVYSTYFQSLLTYKVAKWTGMKESSSILLGSLSGILFQSTIETMDGFSENWGFSLTDMTANLLGAGSFALQQYGWGEQRILFKVSSWPNNYPEVGSSPYSPKNRADELFGQGFFERTLKDYNAQSIWISINPRSFKNDLKIPGWLNVAVGYGAENMFGGFTNEASYDPAYQHVFDDYPRYKQFYLSLDVDLSRIKVKSPFLRTLLDILNIIKVPFSALEINTLGEVKFHLIHF